jgi:predicted DNA binding CopG/RHH family protein
MTGKRVAFGSKPAAKPEANASADEWVKHRDEIGEEPMKRLTIDISESLHRKIKSSCAQRGTKMALEIRELLEKHYG